MYFSLLIRLLESVALRDNTAPNGNGGGVHTISLQVRLTHVNEIFSLRLPGWKFLLAMLWTHLVVSRTEGGVRPTYKFFLKE